MSSIFWAISGNILAFTFLPGISICFIGTIIYLIKFRNNLDKLFECEFLGKLLRVIQEIWEIFFEVLEKNCSCKKSDNCCANLLYYIFTVMLTKGFFISAIAFIGFSLGFILLWSIVKIIILLFVKCCESCCS